MVRTLPGHMVGGQCGLCTGLYHLSLLKAWREAETVFVVTKDQDKLKLAVPNSLNPAPPLFDDHSSPSQRPELAVLQQHSANVFPSYHDALT